MFLVRILVVLSFIFILPISSQAANSCEKAINPYGPVKVIQNGDLVVITYENKKLCCCRVNNIIHAHSGKWYLAGC